MTYKYLVHHQQNATPVGVWNSDKQSHYAPAEGKAESYGNEVLGGADFTNWEDLLDLWSDRSPNGRARWTVFESDSTSLPKVLSEVISDYSEV